VKHILVTNDDGYDARGIKKLVEALKSIARVTVVAPATQKSACGHCMTLTHPMQLISVDDDYYKMDDATPTDCIFLSLHNLFEEQKPDLVISGINVGSNMGEDITYSGTVAGAMEAVLHGVPAIAISQVFNDLGSDVKDTWEYELACEAVINITQKIFAGTFPLSQRKLLNINVPQIKPGECQGYKITKAGYREYGNDSHRHYNPRGEEYFWIGLHPLSWQKDEKQLCDFEAIKANCISISPIKLDLTSYEDIENLESWLEEK
jgi:5'-nucleotidase